MKTVTLSLIKCWPEITVISKMEVKLPEYLTDEIKLAITDFLDLS